MEIYEELGLIQVEPDTPPTDKLSGGKVIIVIIMED